VVTGENEGEACMYDRILVGGVVDAVVAVVVPHVPAHGDICQCQRSHAPRGGKRCVRACVHGEGGEREREERERERERRVRRAPSHMCVGGLPPTLGGGVAPIP
jgi:hypothetical protein